MRLAPREAKQTFGALFWRFGDKWLRVLSAVLRLIFRRVKAFQRGEFLPRAMFDTGCSECLRISIWKIHRSNKAGAGSAPIGSNPGVGTEALTPTPGIDVPTLVIQGSRDKKWRQAMTW